MNENLDLTKILKDAPAGTKLWSPVCGECELEAVRDKSIDCKTTDCYHDYVSFTSSGKFFNNGECILFPSRENHDWSTFNVPKPHKYFKVNQKVLVGLAFNNQYIWKRDIYQYYDENTKRHYTIYEKSVPDSLIIPYDKENDGKLVPTKYYISSSLDNENRPKFPD